MFSFDKNERREALNRLALNDPVLHYFLSWYDAGLISWEDAMTEAAIVLSGQNKDLKNALESVISRSVSPPIVLQMDSFLNLQRSEIQSILSQNSGKFQITVNEGHRIRQWFNSLQDTNPGYLEPEDSALFNKILQWLQKENER